MRNGSQDEGGVAGEEKGFLLEMGSRCFGFLEKALLFSRERAMHPLGDLCAFIRSISSVH